jgi:hypothetical protein
MITIQDPAAGRWGVKLSVSEGNKVYILTHLNLKTSFDRSFATRGESIPLDAWLERQGGVVAEKEVLDHTTFAADITGPDGTVVKLTLASGPTSSLAQPVNGKYSALLPISAAGEYMMKLSVRGETFRREKTFSFKAVEPRGVQHAERPPMAHQAPAPPQPAVSWTAVLIKFLIVNVVIIALTASGYFIRKRLSGRGKLDDKN